MGVSEKFVNRLLKLRTDYHKPVQNHKNKKKDMLFNRKKQRPPNDEDYTGDSYNSLLC